MGEEAQSLEKEAQSRLTGKGDASKGLGQAVEPGQKQRFTT